LDTVALQAEYFRAVSYRDPVHPVVSAYADPKIQFIQQHIPLRGRILDVGCGNGIFTLRFAHAGAQVVGLDFSPALLRQNAHRHVIQGDATALPFDDESFDTTFEANVLHHVEKRERVISEMARTSRRYVVLLEPNRYNPLMFGLSMVVRAERGVLKSSLSRLVSEVHRSGLHVIRTLTTGMISQNNTPESLTPFLKRFDRPIWWGEYHLIIAEKAVARLSAASNRRRRNSYMPEGDAQLALGA
jgi:SAM-dependent methyltransferase